MSESDNNNENIADNTPRPEKDLIDFSYFSKIVMRVAVIEKAEEIPKSKRLLKLSIDLGPAGGKRQLVAGIAAFYNKESLVGRKIVVLTNLKPAKLMGHESQGMLLAAYNDDCSKMFLLDPGQDLPVGSAIG